MDIIYTTVPDKENAISIVNKLIAKKLIACANFFPIQSMYVWEGELNEDQEYTLLLKTDKKKFDVICEEITKIHPYEIPCIMKLSAEAAKPFGQWVNDQLR